MYAISDVNILTSYKAPNFMWDEDVKLVNAADFDLDDELQPESPLGSVAVASGS